MVKFLLPRRLSAPAQAKCYRCGNHTRTAESALSLGRAALFKILVNFDPVKFDKNSRRIRIDITQKPRFNSNDSFKPVC
jgi:hypothetical protein